MVRHAVQKAIDSGLSPVLVVLGFEDELSREALDGLDYLPVYNADYAKGINSSVRLGIQSVPETSPAAVVILADMPLVTAQMIAKVVERYLESEAPLVTSEYDGVRAPPTLYDRSLFAEFDSDRGEGSGKRVVQCHRDQAAALSWPADALTDVDVPDDMARITQLFADSGP